MLTFMIRRILNVLPLSLWLMLSACLFWLSLALVRVEIAAETLAEAKSASQKQATRKQDRHWEFSLAPGYGERSQALVGQDDRQIYLSVDIAYYRGGFFFDNGDLGFNVYDSDRLSVNTLGRWYNERELWRRLNSLGVQVESFTPDSSPSEMEGASDHDDDIEMPDSDVPSESAREYKLPSRDTSFVAGVESILRLPRGQAYLSAFTDISGKHDGQVINLGYRMHHIWRRWYVQPAVNLSWLSDATSDYYFGVKAEEANPVFAEYEATSDTALSTSLLVNYALSSDWFLGFSIKYKKLGNQTVDSPLIEDDAIRTYFVGLKYQF